MKRPTGNRQKTSSLTKALRQGLAEPHGERTVAEEIAEKLMVAALAGEPWAIREVFDRIEGTPHKSVAVRASIDFPEHGTPEGKRILAEALRIVSEGATG